MWNTYFLISDCFRRTQDGGALPIPPSEFETWHRLSNRIMRPEEFKVYSSMDRTFCDGINVGISDFHARQKDAIDNK